MPKTRDDLSAYLASLGIEVTTHDHPPLHTVAESQALRGQIAGRHTKNLFLKDRKDSYFLVTVGEDTQVDLKSIHQVIGAAGRVSFGNPEKLMLYLGVVPGAVTAFGVINDAGRNVKAVLDAELLDHGIVNCHPLVNTATTSIRTEDLVRFMRETGHEPAILKVGQ